MNFPHNFNPATFSAQQQQQQQQAGGNLFDGSDPQAFQQAQYAAAPPHQQPNFYSNPNQYAQTSHQQQPQPHQYARGSMAMQMAAGVGPALVGNPAVDAMGQPSIQQQMTPDGRPFPFTSGSYPSNMSTPAHSNPQQRQPPFNASSISPAPHNPALIPPQQNQLQQQQMQHARQMSSNNAPQLPSGSPRTPPKPAQAPTQSSQKSATSPKIQQREQERVSLLLDINRELLRQVIGLQAAGKTGQIARTNQATRTKDGEGEKSGNEQQQQQKPSIEYIECMRRIQANLAYLASIADSTHKPTSTVPNFPAIMSAPGFMPNLSESYKKLLALFPGTKAQNMPTQTGGGGKPGGGNNRTLTSATTPKIGS